jgi:hypothetical protein
MYRVGCVKYDFAAWGKACCHSASRDTTTKGAAFEGTHRRRSIEVGRIVVSEMEAPNL